MMSQSSRYMSSRIPLLRSAAPITPVSQVNTPGTVEGPSGRAVTSYKESLYRKRRNLEIWDVEVCDLEVKTRRPHGDSVMVSSVSVRKRRGSMNLLRYSRFSIGRQTPATAKKLDMEGRL